MFVIKHKNLKAGTYLTQRVDYDMPSRELMPSVWSADVTKALSFDFKEEVDEYVQYVTEAVGYPVEAVLTFGAQKELQCS